MFIHVAAITTDGIAVSAELSQSDVGRCRPLRIALNSPYPGS